MGRGETGFVVAAGGRAAEARGGGGRRSGGGLAGPRERRRRGSAGAKSPGSSQDVKLMNDANTRPAAAVAEESYIVNEGKKRGSTRDVRAGALHDRYYTVLRVH